MRVIVTTTINPPTEAVLKFADVEGWELVVVLDKKSPPDYTVSRAHILTTEFQENFSPELSNLIGWNCIQRRNIGFLYALQMGAEIIASVDDDNIPSSVWGQNLILGNEKVKEYFCNQDAFDPLSVTNYPDIWHRGYPLELVHGRETPPFSIVEDFFSVQADFWNGDPDVDAITREIYQPNCIFTDESFPFSSNKISPFNSQNTFFLKSVFPDYFLFPFIGRMDDIWASYYLQSVGHRVVYNRASVTQLRNQHSFLKDFENEVIGYSKNLELIQALKSDSRNIKNFLPSRSFEAWQAYIEAVRNLA
jgi:hypothetical protein